MPHTFSTAGFEAACKGVAFCWVACGSGHYDLVCVLPGPTSDTSFGSAAFQDHGQSLEFLTTDQWLEGTGDT